MGCQAVGVYNAQPSFAGCVLENTRIVTKGAKLPNTLEDIGGHKRVSVVLSVEVLRLASPVLCAAKRHTI